MTTTSTNKQHFAILDGMRGVAALGSNEMGRHTRKKIPDTKTSTVIAPTLKPRRYTRSVCMLAISK